jgi:hypothetical protein
MSSLTTAESNAPTAKATSKRKSSSAKYAEHTPSRTTSPFLIFQLQTATSNVSNEFVF